MNHKNGLFVKVERLADQKIDNLLFLTLTFQILIKVKVKCQYLLKLSL